MTRSRHAFTLAEVLIAATLTGTLALAVAQIAANVTHTRRQTAFLLDRLDRLEGWVHPDGAPDTPSAGPAVTVTHTDHPAGHIATLRLVDPALPAPLTRSRLRPGSPP